MITIITVTYLIFRLKMFLAAFEFGTPAQKIELI